MLHPPRLSILYVVQNQKEQAETTLTTLFEHVKEDEGIQVVIVDDGSTDGTREVILSLMDFHAPNNTVYLESEEHKGRGLALTDALSVINSDVLWVVDELQHLDSLALEQALLQLKEEEAWYIVQKGTRIPMQPELWANRVKEGRVFADANVLISLSEMPSELSYFSPSLDKAHIFELLSRLNHAKYAVSTVAWCQDETQQGVRQIELDSSDKLDLLLHLMMLPWLGKAQKVKLLADLEAVLHPSEEVDRVKPMSNSPKIDIKKLSLEDICELAANELRNGNAALSLDYLNTALAQHEGHERLLTLKVKALERMRRYVEAAEIKHSLKHKQAEESPFKLTGVPLEEEEQVHLDQNNLEDVPFVLEQVIQEELPEVEPIKWNLAEHHYLCSIIIPTAGMGKALLEQCLMAIERHLNPALNQLIIVDNASLDDTHEYLRQVYKDQLFPTEVIVNPHNVGFAKSVNQAVRKAEAKYILVLHNDVCITSNLTEQLALCCEEHPQLGLLGVMGTNCLHQNQVMDAQFEPVDELESVKFIDSMVMFGPKIHFPFMDEQFYPCYFDDLDACLQVQQNGHSVAVWKGAYVEHEGGATTNALNMMAYDAYYWNSAHLFQKKWNLDSGFEINPDADPVAELARLQGYINPVRPEAHLTSLYQQLMTAETRHQIHEANYEPAFAIPLMYLFMTMDERELLRRTEELLDPGTLPSALIVQLMKYYFRKTIYSRCKKYLEVLPKADYALDVAMMDVQLLIADHEYDKASSLLNQLMHEMPSHPHLYYIASELHQAVGNTEQVLEFRQLAHQVNPLAYALQRQAE